MSEMTKRRYSADEKERAMARLVAVGAVAASAELGIPTGTLNYWAFDQRRKKGEPASAAPPTSSVAPSDLAPAPPSKAPVPAPPTEAPASSEATSTTSSRNARRRVAKVYTPSQIASALDLVAKVGVRPAAKQLGISRTTLRQWERKVGRAAAGEGDAPTSGPDPKDVAVERDRLILAEWRKQQGLGPSQVRNQLRRGGVKVSTQTVRRVMEEAGYQPPKVERKSHDGRYEAVRPNQLWHLDFVHRYVNQQKVFVLALLDDFSRFVVGWALDDAERADAVIGAFEAAVGRYGKPEALMHDGGSAFWSWKGASRFTRVLEEYGVDQYKVDVPQTNGKSEVFNANLQKELFDRTHFADVGELRRRLGPHLHWYNHHRTHHALGGLLVPADRFYGRAEEVLARIETGQGAPDPLEIATRSLDLFRVTSTRGRTEVWLMGRKVFEGPEK